MAYSALRPTLPHSSAAPATAPLDATTSLALGPTPPHAAAHAPARSALGLPLPHPSVAPAPIAVLKATTPSALKQPLPRSHSSASASPSAAKEFRTVMVGGPDSGTRRVGPLPRLQPFKLVSTPASASARLAASNPEPPEPHRSAALAPTARRHAAPREAALGAAAEGSPATTAVGLRPSPASASTAAERQRRSLFPACCAAAAAAGPPAATCSASCACCPTAASSDGASVPWAQTTCPRAEVVSPAC